MTFAKPNQSNLFLGILVGMLIGFTGSALLALYIAQAPIPFMDKVEHINKPVDTSSLDNKDPNEKLQKIAKDAALEKPLTNVVTVDTTSKPVETTPPKTIDRYMLIIGTYKSKEQADQVASAIAFRGHQAETQVLKDSGSDVYRVYIPDFESPKAASEIKQDLLSIGHNSQIVKQ